MTEPATIGAVILAAIIVAGILIMRGIQRAVYPLREEMFKRAATMLRRGDLPERDRCLIENLLDDALEFRSGWVVVAAAFEATKHAVRNQSTPPAPKLRSDDFDYVLVRYISSALAANPIALLMVLPMMGVVLIHDRFRVKPSMLATAHYVPSVALRTLHH
jgi:hypothetical protein